MPVLAAAFGNIEPLILLGGPILLLAIALLLVGSRRAGRGDQG